MAYIMWQSPSAEGAGSIVRGRVFEGLSIWNNLREGPFAGASSLILLFLRSRLVCGDLPDGLSAVVFPLLTRKTDSCCCLENAIFLKNSWNFTSLWWQHLQIYDGRPSSNAIFNSKNLSSTEGMLSFNAFAPNKSKGWFFTKMFFVAGSTNPARCFC